MARFLDIIKIVFFVASFVIGIFFLRGNYVMSNEMYSAIGKIIMPGYLILAGITIGYIISSLFLLQRNYENHEEEIKIYIKFFLIGILLGIGLSILYIIFG